MQFAPDSTPASAKKGGRARGATPSLKIKTNIYPPRKPEGEITLHKETLMIRTEKQEKFVEYYVLTGNAKRAAIMAGYSAKTAEVNGPIMRKKLSVEIAEATRNALNHHAAMSVKNLVELANNAESESVRLQANKDLLDRAGYKPTDKVEQTVTYDEKTTDELKAELASILGEDHTLQ